MVAEHIVGLDMPRRL